MRGCSCRGTAGFAHVSCLAEQAKILFAEAEENNLGDKAVNERWGRWCTCSQCKQHYHGVVRCALGWACWKTYVGRAEMDVARINAMRQLGNGLYSANCTGDALCVQQAEMSMLRRIRDPGDIILAVQGNIATTYDALRRFEEALRIRRDVYSESLKLNGEEHERTLLAANNYASSLKNLSRFGDAKALIRRTVPLARRVLGEGHSVTLKMRKIYAEALYRNPGATLDDLREAVRALVDLERTGRRVLGSSHPRVRGIEMSLARSRAVLRAREDA